MLKSSLNLKIFLSIFIFVISWLAYYYPVYRKGFAVGGELAQARNLAVSGSFATETDKGVILPAERANEGVVTGVINPLSTIFYAEIFKTLGVNDFTIRVLPAYMAITLKSIFNALLFLLLANLFSIEVALSGALVTALMPIRIIAASIFGFYELSLFFFVIALLAFFDSNQLFRQKEWRLVVASILFALAALARNAFLISFIAFVIYEIYKNRSLKRFLFFVLPFVIVFGTTLTPYSWLRAPNGYLQGSESLYGEVFKDPYTYYYNRDSYLLDLSQKSNLNNVEAHFLSQWGYKVSLKDRIVAKLLSAERYLTFIVSLTHTGGPVIIGLLLIGFISLYREKREWFVFLTLWFGVWITSLIYFEGGNWDHLMEITPIFAVGIGLGMVNISKLLNYQKKYILPILLIFFSWHMAYADFWALHDVYSSGNQPETLRDINWLKSTKPKGTIAVARDAQEINYYTDLPIIFFDPDTMTKLIKDGKEKEAFSLYGVTTAVGFNNVTSAALEKIGIKTLPAQSS